jgi:hypothetical protein
MAKTEVGLALDGGSSHTVVTKEYTKRKKLKKIGSQFPVISFCSPDVEIGDLYEVLLRASGKRLVTVNAIMVSAI